MSIRFRLLTEADVKAVLTMDDLIETMARPRWKPSPVKQVERCASPSVSNARGSSNASLAREPAREGGALMSRSSAPTWRQGPYTTWRRLHRSHRGGESCLSTGGHITGRAPRRCRRCRRGCSRGRPRRRSRSSDRASRRAAISTRWGGSTGCGTSACGARQGAPHVCEGRSKGSDPGSRRIQSDGRSWEAVVGPIVISRRRRRRRSSRTAG